MVSSTFWLNGATASAGAVTWGNGNSGITGPVSAANSLVGTTAYDYVGRRQGSPSVTALSNGNYVVASPNWDNGAIVDAGAATWGDGGSGVTGPVSASNSLVGTTAHDVVSIDGITVLTNGNYVVTSSAWKNGGVSAVGAATWGNGNNGVVGPVSASNSLVGTLVGASATALTNGNFVVASPNWNNGAASTAGAATWGDGSSGIKGPISASNSLVGTTVNDSVSSGVNGVTALSNGNYVVSSSSWNNGTANSAYGAVTWGNGSSGVVGPVSASNSLVGSVPDDHVGTFVTALTNGNYVVDSIFWSNGATSEVGAVTWVDGSTAMMGTVSASNSLIGTTANDQVGVGHVFALSNGNYVVSSSDWNNGAIAGAGATTWGNGASGVVGPVSASNSLVGTLTNNWISNALPGVTALSNGDYVVFSPNWYNGAVKGTGAVTLASGDFRLKGTIQPWNSVLGTVASGGDIMSYAYDPVSQTLIVARPVENIVTLFTMDQIFAGDFDP